MLKASTQNHPNGLTHRDLIFNTNYSTRNIVWRKNLHVFQLFHSPSMCVLLPPGLPVNLIKHHCFKLLQQASFDYFFYLQIRLHLWQCPYRA